MTAVTPELLRRYDVPGPRYTSYPTADRFTEEFNSGDYEKALQRRRSNGMATHAMSLYVHIPFCDSLCYYCACNKIITKHHERAQTYLEYLSKEVALQVAHCGRKQPVSQLHIGGGTPTFLSDAELTQLMQLLRDNFKFESKGEYSIEIDPRSVSRERLAHLAQLGFNRLSFGVQDFDPLVQKAVHREQPSELVFGLVDASRELGFESVNVDLIYGLPQQTAASFARTLAQVTELKPDRIALYAYAHLPERFKPQRRIDTAALPVADAKLEMLSNAMDVFMRAGYVYVGMDHFALPTDALAIAKRQGRLHRNFQGYSTHPDCDLIALGVSAIGKMGATYSQNAKTLDAYYAMLDGGHLPVVRGLTLNRDDMVRRAVIMALMCQGEVLFESIDQAWIMDFRSYFSRELQQLELHQEQGLVVLNGDGVRVTSKGWFFVRAVAMVFDSYLQNQQAQTKFSRII